MTIGLILFFVIVMFGVQSGFAWDTMLDHSKIRSDDYWGAINMTGLVIAGDKVRTALWFISSAMPGCRRVISPFVMPTLLCLKTSDWSKGTLCSWRRWLLWLDANILVQGESVVCQIRRREGVEKGPNDGNPYRKT